MTIRFRSKVVEADDKAAAGTENNPYLFNEHDFRPFTCQTGKSRYRSIPTCACIYALLLPLGKGGEVRMVSAMPFDPHKIRIGLAASPTPEAQAAAQALSDRHDFVPAAQAELMVVLGGDGFMLQQLHHLLGRKVPVYGMNRGTIGFLMNDFDTDGLIERIGRRPSMKCRYCGKPGRQPRLKSASTA
jgi:hypothetical protein